MGQKRRRFTAGFKARVALEALKDLYTVQGIAQRNGLHPNQVSAWKRQASEGTASAFESGSGNSDRQRSMVVESSAYTVFDRPTARDSPACISRVCAISRCAKSA